MVYINYEMYIQFYKLKEKPFNVTADPNFLFFSRKHKEAFSHLIYGINQRVGFLIITGEIGTGKTTLCRALLNSLDEKTKSAFIIHSSLSEVQLLQSILDDFNIKLARKTKLEMLSRLNEFLIEQLRTENNVILIIDEAQNLRMQQLEQIRLLSNLETEKEKLIQIILVGQPQLKEKIDTPELRQLRQRIAVRYHIEPLDRDEVGDYIRHRLLVAGSDGSIVFVDEALDEIYNYSSGIPRSINLICDKALLLGYVIETNAITKDIIRRSIEELEGRIMV